MGILDEAEKIESRRIKKAVKEGLKEKNNGIICPPDCQSKHSDSRAIMARIEQKVDDMNKKIDDTLQEIKDLAKNKADKEEVNDLKNKYWIAVAGVIGLLITIIILLITHSTP